MRHLTLLATVFALLVSAPHAAQRGSTDLDTLLREAVEQKRVPLVVAMVADAKGVTYEHAVGADLDAIFPIASMTKPVTSAAVLQLVEAGRVKLDEPAVTYVPALASVQVSNGGTRRAPRTPLTVRHLLTHTAGFGYEFLNSELLALVSKKQVPSIMAGGDAFLAAPLLFDPGVRWEYGISTDWLGKLVERVSGQSLDAYFRQHIFEPLGMADSSFDVPPGERARVVTAFQRSSDGTLAKQPPPPAKPVEFHSGGGGLFSTAADYMKFLRALMAGGQLGDRRILSAESVAAMGANQIGTLTIRAMPSVIPQLAADRAALPGAPDTFGLGFALNSKPLEGGRGANTMSWAGIYNTFFWVDREKQVAAVFMTQMLPFLDPGAGQAVEAFDRAVYARTR